MTGVEIAILIGSILKEVLPPLIDAVTELVKDKTKEEVEEMRKQPVKVSVAFGGGPSESSKTLAEIEAKLPE